MTETIIAEHVVPINVKYKTKEAALAALVKMAKFFKRNAFAMAVRSHSETGSYQHQYIPNEMNLLIRDMRFLSVLSKLSISVLLDGKHFTCELDLITGSRSWWDLHGYDHRRGEHVTEEADEQLEGHYLTLMGVGNVMGSYLILQHLDVCARHEEFKATYEGWRSRLGY